MNAVVVNQPGRLGPIFRFFKGLWDAMNFTRRLIFNLIFFGLLLLILIALASGDRATPLLERTTLVLQPEGRLVEQYTCDPFTRQLMAYDSQGRCAEVQVRDLLRAIEVDFADVLAKKNATVSVRQIIRELEAAQATLWSPMILNGSGFGILANHSLVMANYISRANAAVIDLRQLLSQG